MFFIGCCFQAPPHNLCNNTGSGPSAPCSPRRPRAYTLTPRGRTHLSSPTTAAEAGAGSNRHRVVLECGGGRQKLRHRRELSPVRLSPRQLQLQLRPAALEEDRGGERAAPPYGLYADAVPVWLHVLFCCSSQGHLWTLRYLLWTSVHKCNHFHFYLKPSEKIKVFVFFVFCLWMVMATSFFHLKENPFLLRLNAEHMQYL